VISIAGIPLSVLSDSLTFHEAAGDTDVEKLKSVFQDMHGHIPPYFYSNGIHKLAAPIIEGSPMITSNFGHNILWLQTFIILSLGLTE
jgi:hypothetical protein